MFENWESRQRGFLTVTGKWNIVFGREVRECFCVAPPPETGCGTFFANARVFNDGQWSVRGPDDSRYNKFGSRNYLGKISMGAHFFRGFFTIKYIQS